MKKKFYNNKLAHVTVLALTTTLFNCNNVDFTKKANRKSSNAGSAVVETTNGSLHLTTPTYLNDSTDKFRAVVFKGESCNIGFPRKSGDIRNNLLNSSLTSSCIADDIEVAYEEGKQIVIDGLADGDYSVLISLENKSGWPLEQGSGKVTITDGSAETIDITLVPVNKTQWKNETTTTGEGSISINIKRASDSVNKLAFVDSSLVTTNGTCKALHINLQDSSGDSAYASSTLSLALSSSSSTGYFYSDVDCTNQISGVTLKAYISTFRIYYKDSSEGTMTLSVSELSSLGLTAGSTSIIVQ